MSGVLLIACTLVSALAVDAARADPVVERPTAESTLLVVGLPIEVLRDDAVRDQLTSGLTTSLVLQVETVGGGSQGKIKGGARIDVRFEPWDEIFTVLVVGIDGQGERLTFDTIAALETWWRGLRLPIVVDPALTSMRAGRVRLDLDVIPFSEQEQRDTQRWFTDVLDASGAAREISTATGSGNDALRQVFHLLMATSIRRRPLVSFGWTVPWHVAPARDRVEVP